MPWKIFGTSQARQDQMRLKNNPYGKYDKDYTQTASSFSLRNLFQRRNPTGRHATSSGHWRRSEATLVSHSHPDLPTSGGQRKSPGNFGTVSSHEKKTVHGRDAVGPFQSSSISLAHLRCSDSTSPPNGLRPHGGSAWPNSASSSTTLHPSTAASSTPSFHSNLPNSNHPGCPLLKPTESHTSLASTASGKHASSRLASSPANNDSQVQVGYYDHSGSETVSPAAVEFANALNWGPVDNPHYWPKKQQPGKECHDKKRHDEKQHGDKRHDEKPCHEKLPDKKLPSQEPPKRVSRFKEEF